MEAPADAVPPPPHRHAGADRLRLRDRAPDRGFGRRPHGGDHGHGSAPRPGPSPARTGRDPRRERATALSRPAAFRGASTPHGTFRSPGPPECGSRRPPRPSGAPAPTPCAPPSRRRRGGRRSSGMLPTAPASQRGAAAARRRSMSSPRSGASHGGSSVASGDGTRALRSAAPTSRRPGVRIPVGAAIPQPWRIAGGSPAPRKRPSPLGCRPGLFRSMVPQLQPQRAAPSWARVGPAVSRIRGAGDRRASDRRGSTVQGAPSDPRNSRRSRQPALRAISSASAGRPSSRTRPSVGAQPGSTARNAPPARAGTAISSDPRISVASRNAATCGAPFATTAVEAVEAKRMRPPPPLQAPRDRAARRVIQARARTRRRDQQPPRARDPRPRRAARPGRRRGRSPRSPPTG